MRMILAVVLSACIVAANVFSAGGREEDAAVELQLSESGTFPIVDEPVEIDVWTIYNPIQHTGDKANAAFTDYLEDLTNVVVNFVDIVEWPTAEEKVNLILASGDLPDLFMSSLRPSLFSGAELFQYGSTGMFLPVDELIASRMPNLAQRLENEEWVRKQSTMPDGNMYAFPSAASGYHNLYPGKFWIYEPWLEAVGMDYPTTTDELYEVLTAFKTMDPNGNGLADEIPMTGFDGNGGGWIDYMMSPFIYTDSRYYLQRDGASVSFVANTPEWREGLRYLERLYREGLLHPDTFTQDRNRAKALVENPDVPLVGSYGALWYGMISVNGGGTGRFADIKVVPPLAGPTGYRSVMYNEPSVVYAGVITEDAEYPELIAQWYDWFYESYENSLLGQFWWQEGGYYRSLTEEEQAMGLITGNGEPARFIFNEAFVHGGAEKNQDGWIRSVPTWPFEGEGFALPPGAEENPADVSYRLMTATRDHYEPLHSDSFLPANLLFDDAVIEEYTEVLTIIIDLVNQYAAEFITGVQDIDDDSDWNAYTRELERAGLDLYIRTWDDGLSAAGY